jgi:hypothetical protein
LRSPPFLCSAGPGDVEEDPGATLVLRGDGPEQLAVAQWLLTVESDCPTWSTIPAGMNIQANPALGTVLSALTTAGLGGLRNREVFQALLAGAAVTRSLREVSISPSLTINLDDYELVRRLLQSHIVHGADEAYNPLAADMAGRANVFLAVKCGVGSSNPFASGDPVVDDAQRPPRELVTRREVSDLGNVRSRMVWQLVEFLQSQPDGFERFCRMGLVRRPPDHEAWRRAEVGDLVACLRSWSAKQVRTHFDLLCRTGMLTAEWEHPNGPWRYGLPEELTIRSTAFGGLPPLHESTTHAQVS